MSNSVTIENFERHLRRSINVEQEPVTIFSNEYRKGKKATRLLEGFLVVQTNHDGTISHFIHLDLDRTKKTTHRIPLMQGDLAVIAGTLYYIENVFLEPDRNNFILAVSPYQLTKEV